MILRAAIFQAKGALVPKTKVKLWTIRGIPTRQSVPGGDWPGDQFENPTVELPR